MTQQFFGRTGDTGVPRNCNGGFIHEEISERASPLQDHAREGIRRITSRDIPNFVSTSIVHQREAWKPALLDGAAAVIFFHNHPSGDPAPSREDRDCTNRLIEASKILGIRVLDHIIFGQTDYYSFADAGLIT